MNDIPFVRCVVMVEDVRISSLPAQLRINFPGMNTLIIYETDEQYAPMLRYLVSQWPEEFKEASGEQAEQEVSP